MTRFLFVLILMFVISCDNTTSSDGAKDPVADYTLLKTAYNNGIKVEVYVEKTPEVGYNIIHVLLADSLSNKRINNATLTFQPLMDMGNMKHRSPFENPAVVEPMDGLFTGSVTFIMAGMWKMTILFKDNDTGKNGQVRFMTDVMATQNVKKVTGSDSMDYFITLLEPMAPRVGMNDFELCVNYRASMMSFPAVEDVFVEISPTMPSMGHGSPNNENPKHVTGAHYKGKVNFTMTGAWQVVVSIKKNSTAIAEVIFDITL